MAKTTITNVEINKFNTAVAGKITTAACGSDGGNYVAEVDFSKRSDDKMLLILENAAAASKTATIKAGTKLQGVADLPISLASSSGAVVVVESGKFVNDAGKVVIHGTDGNVKVAAVELP